MSSGPVSNLAAVQGATLEVRKEGRLLARVHPAKAEELIQRGWATLRGAGTRKYIELLSSAPWTPLSGAWRGGSHTTERIRNDSGVIIRPRIGSGLQHKPIPRDI